MRKGMLTTRLLMGTCLIALVMSAANVAQATPVTLSGTLSGVDSNGVKDDGDGNHDYAIDRTIANTFYLSPGTPVSITGTVDVRGLTGGSYLEIGLVDKEQADFALGWPWPSGMFNNSAYAIFYAGTRDYARLGDYNYSESGQLSNALGTTPGVFDFTLDILSNGTMGLTLHGTNDVSLPWSYGTRNWGDPEDPDWYQGMGNTWSGGELENGAYLIAQLWIDTGNMLTPVSASYDITGSPAGPAPVPEPASMAILGMGLVGLVATRMRKRQSV